MPSITGRTQNIREIGPVLECLIAPSQIYIDTLKLSKDELPEPVKVRALIDTGASTTVVQKGIAKKLGLNVVSVIRIGTPSHINVECEVYDIAIIFDITRVTFPNIMVIEAPLEGQDIQCLIGRDLLSTSVFIYNGIDNSFTLSI
jgi:predicted aspartyl protease